MEVPQASLCEEPSGASSLNLVRRAVGLPFNCTKTCSERPVNIGNLGGTTDITAIRPNVNSDGRLFFYSFRTNGEFLCVL